MYQRQNFTSTKEARLQPAQARVVARSSMLERPEFSSSLNGFTSVPSSSGRIISGREVEEAALKRSVDVFLANQRGQSTCSVDTAWLRKTYSPEVLGKAYERCGVVTGEYAKTFYLGTQLMPPEKASAIWAVYVWCRRTDELVDGPNASRITPQALDRWEERLEAIFEGRPFDELDAALTDTVARFPLDIQPFRDMVGGMRMDLVKTRYNTFDELYEYCYRVAGTVGLMSTPVMGVDPSYKGPLDPVFRAALALGTANQLTNILRDVGEDIKQRDRIYLPLEELDRFGISEKDVLMGKRDDRWREFMKFQIGRARDYFAQAEAGVDELSPAARWPVWSALILYRQILDAIEANDYDSFSQRAYVTKWNKLRSLPIALLRANLRGIDVPGASTLPAEAKQAKR